MSLLIWNFLALFYQGGDPLASLTLKRALEVARFIWVLDFVNLLTVCLVPLVSTSSVSLCGRVNFLHFEILGPLSR